jgi:hypothetical protein
VPGLVLDIRGNHGGYDTLAANLCGTFASTPSFHESTEFYDKRTNSFLRFTLNGQTGELVDALMITPQATRFQSPVVALVNPNTISSGEGLARCVNQLDRGGVVGFYGTRGSFAEAGGAITLPNNLVIHYPYGRSVDAHGVVQVDSRHGRGGIVPKYRVWRNWRIGGWPHRTVQTTVTLFPSIAKNGTQLSERGTVLRQQEVALKLPRRCSAMPAAGSRWKFISSLHRRKNGRLRTWPFKVYSKKEISAPSKAA